jgi:cell division initiation protein
VDKVEDYRSTEDSMRMALLQAEKTAKEIVEAAEAKRDAVESEVEQKKSELMRQAEAEAEERRAEIRQSLATEEAALDRARRATAEYLGKLKAAMAEYAETVERVYDFVEPLPPQPEPADAPEETAPEASAPEEPASEGVSQDTVENIAEIINRAFSSLEEKEKSAEEEPYKEFTSSTIPKIDYNNLQFGENYDPKNKK